LIPGKGTGFLLNWGSFPGVKQAVCDTNLQLLGLRRDEVTGKWRKLHNEELRDLYSSPSIIRMIKSRRMRWAGHEWGKKKNTYRLLVGKLEGKRLLGRARCRWVDNIKMDLERSDGVMWTGLVWLRIETG
jgi:hypothetical protein